MNTAQVTACQSGICVKNICGLHQHDSKPCVLPMSISPCSRILMSLGEKPSFGLKCQPVLKSRKPLRVCSAGGKGMMENNDENSPWKSITKAMEKFKGQSIEDMLRQQIQKGEYFENGGGGAKPPGGGGGDGGGGDGGTPDGTGGPEDESFIGMFDENLQVILATSALLFLHGICSNANFWWDMSHLRGYYMIFQYVYLLAGKELLKIIKDYIKYIFGGGQSIRLRSIMVKAGLFYKNMTEKKEVDEYWLEKAILNTPTWWYDPRDFRRAVRNYYASPSDSDSDE